MSDEMEKVGEDVVSAEEAERPQTRRRLLQAAGAAAGAVAASRLLAPESAAAADGGNLVLGAANAATSKTSLATSGPISNDGALSVSAPAADYGVYGSGASYGVVGSGPGGVLGLGTVGGVFSGSEVAINLDPQAAPGAPTGQAFKGDMAIDSTGILWLCVAASLPGATPGTWLPGTWIQVSHGGTRLLSNPQRVYDSRGPGAGGILKAGTTRDIDITATSFGIPSNAIAIVGNLTVTETTTFGYLGVYPAGGALLASNVNWGGANQTLANAATIKLGTAGRITAAVVNSDAQVIVDVHAYIL